jgi:hypothetical protein
MKPWHLIVGVIVVFALIYALSALVGMLFWIGITGVILACLVGVLRGVFGDRLRMPSKRVEKKLDREAERAVREIERNIQK